MFKSLLAAFAIMVAVPSVSLACTIEEATKKGQDLQTAVQAAITKDPKNAQGIMTKIQAFTTKYQGEATPSDAACADFDKLIADIKSE